MATTAFKNALQKASTRGLLLFEIDLIGTGVNYDTSKTIYLSDRYITIEGVIYEGVINDFGGMDVDLSQNEGIASINDFSISIKNTRLQFMESPDLLFSDLLDEFFFTGSICRVYQWSEELSSKSDAELIFKGIVKQPDKIDKELIEFEIEEDTSVYIDIPRDTITIEDFANAPNESIDLPLPFVYGNDYNSAELKTYNSILSPCIETDSLNKEFYISKTQLKTDTIGFHGSNAKIFFQGSNLYADIEAVNSTFINDGDGFRFILGDNVLYSAVVLPIIKGGQYTSIITDWSNIFTIAGGSIQLNDDEKFFLKLDKVPNIGSLEGSLTSAISLFYSVDTFSGTKVDGRYATIQYYNPNWQGGGTNFSTGQDIEDVAPYELIADKSKHGSATGQEDQENAWTWDELGGIEFGITVKNNAGDPISFNLNWMYLVCFDVALVYNRSLEQRRR